MFILIFIIMIVIHRLSITFARDIDALAGAHIFQVALPAASGGNLQYEAVCVCIVRPSTGHDKVGGECTFIQREKGARTSKIGVDSYV